MRHNQQVADNIRRISDQVDAAKTQDDLVAVITNVGQHPGPLDYNDRPNYIVATVLSLTVLYCLFVAFVSPVHYLIGSAIVDIVFQGIIIYSVLWMPALINLYLAIRLDNWAVSRLNLDKLLPKAELRFAAAFIAPVLLFYQLPAWHQLYWGLVELVGSFLPFYYDESYTGTAIICLILLFFLWQFLLGRRNWREGISKRIFLLDTLFNNNLRDLSSQKSSRFDQLDIRFADFERGNDTRELVSLYQGEHQGDLHCFDYQIYRFHYVVKRTSTSTDSDGNTTTTTTRTSHYRHGIVLPFAFAKGLLLSADGKRPRTGVRYKTASSAFDRLFRITAQDEMDAARFLSPAVIEKLSALPQQVRKPVLEISSDGLLCLAFNDDDLIHLKREHSLKNPQAFAEEIAGHAQLDKLEGLLDLMHDLMRLCDNNFESNTEHRFESATA